VGRGGWFGRGVGVLLVIVIVLVVVVGRRNRGKMILAWKAISHVEVYYPRFLYFGHHPPDDAFASIHLNSLASVPFPIGKTPGKHHSIQNVEMIAVVAAMI